jgi:hypothetical protein
MKTDNISLKSEGAANGAIGERAAFDPRDVLSDTGNPEADRLIGRLTSADPDFNDCTDAAVFIRKMVVEHRGPDGFATWKDAAVDERQKRAALTAEKVVGQDPFPYQKTFNAIAAATSLSAGHIAISVSKFVEAFGEPQQPAQSSKEQ